MTPCQQKCKLVKGVCSGCGRPIELIRVWRDLSDEEREKELKK